MKTVVQQIIEKFEHIQKNDCKTLAEHIFFDGVLAILESEYLEKEKQQIIDAQNYSQRGVHGEIYYNMVYGSTNKETLK